MKYSKILAYLVSLIVTGIFTSIHAQDLKATDPSKLDPSKIDLSKIDPSKMDPEKMKKVLGENPPLFI